MVFCFLCVAFSSFEKVKKLKIKKEELMWTVFCALKCVEMLVCSLYTLSSTGFEMFSSHFLPWVSSRNGCSAFCHRLNKSDFHFTGISSFYLFMAVLGLCCCVVLQCMKVKRESEVAQSCPILLDPMDCSPPGSSAHGILQARVLEWGAIAFFIQRIYWWKIRVNLSITYEVCNLGWINPFLPWFCLGFPICEMG